MATIDLVADTTPERHAPAWVVREAAQLVGDVGVDTPRDLAVGVDTARDRIPLWAFTDARELVGSWIDRYELIAHLHAGQDGNTFLARQEPLGREALLLLRHGRYAVDDPTATRFLTRASRAARLSHPNALRVFDCGHSGDGMLYLVTDQLRGASLADRLLSEGPISPQRAARIAAQVAAALAEAHGIGAVHGALSARDVFFEPARGHDDLVIVRGFARPVEADRVLDPGLDLQALGRLLYHMITGRDSGSLPNPRDLVHSRLFEDAPPDLVALVFALLGNHDELPPSTEAVRARLARAGDGERLEDEAAPGRADQLKLPLALSIVGLQGVHDLITADAESGVLSTRGTELPVGSHLVLVSGDGALGPLRIYAHVVDAFPESGTTTLRWTRISTTGHRRYLNRFIAEVLGVDLQGEFAEAPIAEHHRLSYEPSRTTLALEPEHPPLDTTDFVDGSTPARPYQRGRRRITRPTGRISVTDEVFSAPKRPEQVEQSRADGPPECPNPGQLRSGFVFFEGYRMHVELVTVSQARCAVVLPSGTDALPSGAKVHVGIPGDPRLGVAWAPAVVGDSFVGRDHRRQMTVQVMAPTARFIEAACAWKDATRGTR